MARPMTYDDFGTDAVSMRRRSFSPKPMQPARQSWDVPEGWNRTPATPGAAAGVQSPWGGHTAAVDSEELQFRNMALADATARSAGGRLAAQNASPNDAALAAYGGLEGQLRGQGDAARGAMSVSADMIRRRREQRFAEYMARLQAQLQEDAIREANKNSWIGDLASLGGTLGGAFLGRPR